MNGEYIIYALIGIVALYVLVKLLKWPLKILINGIIGVIMLYVTNFIIAKLALFGVDLNFTLAINPVNALVAGFFGVPGVIALIIIGLFI